MAATYNITTLTGSDVSATFTFTGLNIVGTMSATAQMRKTAASPDIVALFTTSLNASGDYVYDLKIDDSSDDSSVIYIKGKVTLEQAVTR